MRHLVAVDIVANSVDFVADTVDFVATRQCVRSTLSTFHEVDRVKFNFVASVYRVYGYCTLTTALKQQSKRT